MKNQTGGPLRTAGITGEPNGAAKVSHISLPNSNTISTTGIDLNQLVGGLRNPSFGQFIETREPRVVQIAARFNF